MKDDGNTVKKYLQPSTIFVSANPVMVHTVLGSCVSVCLWDKTLNIGGINHYMLPLWNGKGLATPMYGNIAIERLIEKMIGSGCSKKNLVAKIFGGSKTIIINEKKNMDIGNNNVSIAGQILRSENIPIVSSSLGGNLGRELHFQTDTGAVFQKYIMSNLKPQLKSDLIIL